MNKDRSFKWIPLGIVVITCLLFSIGYIRVQNTLSLPTYSTLTTASTLSSIVSSSSPSHRIHIASTPHTSLLVKRIFTLGYEGVHPLPIIHESIDQASLAVKDSLIQGALSLSTTSTPSPKNFILGRTSVEWVSRGESNHLSVQNLKTIWNTRYASIAASSCSGVNILCGLALISESMNCFSEINSEVY